MEEYLDVLPWVALNRLSGLGPVSQRKLLEAAGGMPALLQAGNVFLQQQLPAELVVFWRDFCEEKSSSVLRRQAQRDVSVALEAGATVLILPTSPADR